ncbi:MAG: hydrogenase nickel incorporation protein HypB [Selenomonadaceae bacterium]
MEVKVMKDILGENDDIASKIHGMLSGKKIFTINLMGSPGSGKTTLLEQTMKALNGELRMAVIEGDLFTSKDADRISKYGVPVVQINTTGGCHLEAPMVEKVLAKLDLDNTDLLVIENVGNLVCPAEFAIGEDEKVVVLSVTEGNDKPMKYPLIFKESTVSVINKIDLVPYTDFDVNQAVDDITTIHPSARVLPLSCRTGEGLDAWLDYLREGVKRKRG